MVDDRSARTDAVSSEDVKNCEMEKMDRVTRARTRRTRMKMVREAIDKRRNVLRCFHNR